MPTYEYVCKSCNCLFEEVLLQPEDVKKFIDSHPCSCGAMAERVRISVTNFTFKGEAGRSGAHDLDYPTLDKAIGRSAASRWQKFHSQKAERDKVRKESGSNAITMVGDKPVPTPPEQLAFRQSATNALKKAVKDGTFTPNEADQRPKSSKVSSS